MAGYQFTAHNIVMLTELCLLIVSRFGTVLFLFVRFFFVSIRRIRPIQMLRFADSAQEMAGQILQAAWMTYSRLTD